MTKHHLFPKAKGGRGLKYNKVRLCFNCHTWLHAKIRLANLTPEQRELRNQKFLRMIQPVLEGHQTSVIKKLDGVRYEFYAIRIKAPKGGDNPWKNR